MVETFFKSIKAELIWRNRWDTRRQAAYSGVIRPVFPKVSGHPFRFYPATDSGASGHPVM
jgi:hypothetical protein